MTTPAQRGYLPDLARIAEIVVESSDTRTFRLEPETGGEAYAAAEPGQFVMLSLFGSGEAPFTLSSLPARASGRAPVDLTIRRTGALTGALFRLAVGDRLGLRGPFGRGFPIDAAAPAVYVAGGCGLSPLKAAIERQLERRPPATPVAIVYGARSAATRIHREAIAAWQALPGVQVIECVEHADPGWAGRVGLCTAFVAEAVAAVRATRAAVCGPSPMMCRAAEALRACGVDPQAIHLSIERHMKCGLGHCGHCYVDQRYVCRDGPVFSLAELAALPEAFAAERRDAHAATSAGDACPAP